jgi:hypothetical protein
VQLRQQFVGALAFGGDTALAEVAWCGPPEDGCEHRSIDRREPQDAQATGQGDDSAVGAEHRGRDPPHLAGRAQPHRIEHCVQRGVLTIDHEVEHIAADECLGLVSEHLHCTGVRTQHLVIVDVEHEDHVVERLEELRSVEQHPVSRSAAGTESASSVGGLDEVGAGHGAVLLVGARRGEA